MFAACIPRPLRVQQAALELPPGFAVERDRERESTTEIQPSGRSRVLHTDLERGTSSRAHAQKVP